MFNISIGKVKNEGAKIGYVERSKKTEAGITQIQHHKGVSGLALIQGGQGICGEADLEGALFDGLARTVRKTVF